MKNKMFITLVVTLFAGVFLFSFTTAPTGISGDFKYIGVTKCVGACHKTESQGSQLDIWKASKHANAWKVLETEEANKIAKEKGFSAPAIDVPECVKCHVLGKELDPALLTETFDKTEGVQCETCHGPGSEYKSMSIMKDKQKAIENGLIIPDNKEEFCTGCHNDKSPTFKGFEFEKYWEQIKHYKPSSK
jgi:excinuclease UvrABC ATPase subunit